MAQGDLWTKYASNFQLKKVSVRLTAVSYHQPNMTNFNGSAWPRVVIVDIKDEIGCLKAVKVRSDAVTIKLKVFCECDTCKLKGPNVKAIYISSDSVTKRVSNIAKLKQKKCASQPTVIKPKKINWRRIESDESDDELERSLLYPPGESDGEISDVDIKDEEELLLNSPPLKDISVQPLCSEWDVKKVVEERGKSLPTDRVVEECKSNSETVLVTFNNDKCKDDRKTSKHRHSSNNGTDSEHNKDLKNGKTTENRKIHKRVEDSVANASKSMVSDKRRLDVDKARVQSKFVAQQPEIKNSTPAVTLGKGDLRNTLNGFRIPKVKKAVEGSEPKFAVQNRETFGGDVKSRLGRKLSDAEFDIALSRQSSSGSGNDHEPDVSSGMTSVNFNSSGVTSVTNEQSIFSEEELKYWNDIKDDWTDEDVESKPIKRSNSEWSPYFPLTTDAYLRPRIKAKRTVPVPIVDQSEVQDINDPDWELTKQQLSHWESHRQVWGNQPCPNPKRNLSTMQFRFRKLGVPSNSYSLNDGNDTTSDSGLLNEGTCQSIMFTREVFSKKEASLSEYFDKIVEDENNQFKQEKKRVCGGDTSEVKVAELSTRHATRLHEMNLHKTYCLNRLNLAHDEIVDFQMKMKSLCGNEYLSTELILDEKEVVEIKDADRMFHMFSKYYVSK